MLFPVVIHKDKDSCYGATIPDIPGCFSAGDTLEEAINNIQEAVEAHLEGESIIPEPSKLEALIHDPEYKDGTWVMVDIDMSFLEGRAIRINITVPSNVLHKIDQTTKNRSAFFVKAAKAMIN